MGKLAVLDLDELGQGGFRVVLEIGAEGSLPEIKITGQLPPADDLLEDYGNWQSTYRSMRYQLRAIKPKSITIDLQADETREKCRDLADELGSRLNRWLKSESFVSIREELLGKVSASERVRLLIRTDNLRLRQLPWHRWDLLERYPQAEIALSAPEYKYPPELRKTRGKNKVKILAILGDSQGIEVEKDKQLLASLPNAKIVFLEQPQRQQLGDRLWEQAWDILFFAGHSETEGEGEKGRIYINSTDSLTIEELAEALKKALASGLQLAIFNSCDGLGLAQQLEHLHIPNAIIMREPVQDKIAQVFLKYFLEAFAGAKGRHPLPLDLAVREARKRLQSLENEFPCASWLPVICQNPAVAPPTWQQLRGSDRPKFFPAAIASIAVAFLAIALRQLGAFQAWELQAYDLLMRQRPQEGADPRLLIVEATQEDVNQHGSPLPDAVLAQVIEKLEAQQARVIGLNIFRDRSMPRDSSELTPHFQNSDRLIAVCSGKVGDYANKSGVAPPSGLPEERLGFSDVVVDPDGVIRRHLLFMTLDRKDPCSATDHSLSMRLALHYLAKYQIEPETIPPKDVRLGSVVFRDMDANPGGYRGLDDRGIQVMLNYRASKNIARQVGLAEVLAGEVNPDWVKDRIVLIGLTAPIYTDYHSTPYSAGEWPYQKMPRLLVQAEMTSQIISAVLDGRPLLWVWSEWGEFVWIWVWSAAGGLLAWRCRRIVFAIFATGAATGFLYGLCWVILIQGGWVPLVPSALALVVTSGTVVVYNVFEERKYVYWQ
ncbi:MAG: CHASE2 domain-containing protein [Oscillatoria sp. SIO1A7]|nr:CHASE2 domain-containing protein [Oscillatoria sp. SIO1A7]